jgi:hypothetical protein
MPGGRRADPSRNDVDKARRMKTIERMRGHIRHDR